MNQDVLIIGSSACALRMAQNLAGHGVGVLLAAERTDSRPIDGIQWLEGTRILQCRGYAGAFEVKLSRNGTCMTRHVAAIAVATDEFRRPGFEACDLAPSPHVTDITAVEAHLALGSDRDPLAAKRQIVFLSGLKQDSHPKVFARMLEACLKLQKNGVRQTYLITGNLKVAGDGLEAMCHEAKAAGTVFIKYTERAPRLQALPDGRVVVDYRDELTRDDCRLDADWVVVDETLEPDPTLEDLCRSLALEHDRSGYAQGDNVRLSNNLTNRRGIFVAGAARALLTSVEIERDADHAALEIMTFLSDADREDLPLVQIDPGRCGRCLTCHRACPHSAIDIGMHMAVVSQACQSCGICAASCPARAIDIEGSAVEQMLTTLAVPSGESDKEKIFKPKIVVFGCARSAEPAHRLAGIGGSVLPEDVQFVTIPCGGAVSQQHLLTAFESGADGVLVCTCHEDNCRSGQGIRQARRRTASALAVLDISQIRSDRLQITTLAANMGREFFQTVTEFHRKVKAMGPLYC